MSYISSIPCCSGSGSGSGDLPTADVLDIDSGEATVDFTIAADAFKAVITNAGFAGGGTDDTATVNGINLFPGNRLEFEAKLDPVNNLFKLLPQIDVVTNGATIWWYEER